MKKTSHIKKWEDFPNCVIQKFKTFNWTDWFGYCVILFIVGAFINIQTGFVFPHFFVHQLLLIAATTLLIYAMKSFFLDVWSLSNKSPSHLLLKVPEVNGVYENRFLPLQKSPWIFPIAFFVMVFFFSCIILVEYIKIDVIGVYAIYIAGSSIMIGTYAYGHYLSFLWFIYQIGNCRFDRRAYNVYVPAETEWIKKIAKMSQNLRNFFLSVALLYTLEFSILIPVDKIELSDKGLFLHTPNNTAFVVFWVAFFLLVIIAFPVINYAQHKLVVRVINRLKSQTIDELSTLMFEEYGSIKDKRNRMYSVISYNTLIENVRQTKDYPISRQLSYETVMTVVTFAVHMINLITKITSISPLNALLV